jgi:hypothetical protein
MCLLVLLTATVGCKVPLHGNLPPAEQIARPGPGVDGPGPGVMTCAATMPAPALTSQVAFVGPEGMVVAWDVGMPGAFDSAPLVCPGRYNFPQGAIYRLKLTNIPSRPGVELYPTLEVGPAMPRTAAFIAHNAIPVAFTEEDFDQILSGNFVTKVIYLPDPEYQELALAGVETLVSTRLDPGVDPVVEADRRGAILAIVRVGNKDLETPAGAPGPEVVQAAYGMNPGFGPAGVPMGAPMGAPGAAYGAGTVPSNYISGVTGAQYGMPISGTPIGLPGPPHVPLGGPAGLQKHTMRNHTMVHVPGPTKHVRIDVRQDPGMVYPKPANHAWITERSFPSFGAHRGAAAAPQACPPGMPVDEQAAAGYPVGPQPDPVGNYGPVQ